MPNRVLIHMDMSLLGSKFLAIGARLKFGDRLPRWRPSDQTFTVDVRTDRRGEYFEIVRESAAGSEVDVLDVDRKEQHLLLLVRADRDKQKFLCGHDERHWFVAGIPGKAPVGTVRQAKDALKPTEVRAAEAREHLRSAARNRRKNAAFVRQGEWFFLPAAGMFVEDALVRRNEPLRRGNGGKPHWAEFCYRSGGEAVRVCSRHPNGVTEGQYRKLIRANPRAIGWGWSAMRRNPGVYVRGRVRHPDHRTIVLHGWHRVLMNTEGQSSAMRNIAFLD